MKLEVNKKYIIDDELRFKYLGNLDQLSIIEFESSDVLGHFSQGRDYYDIIRWFRNSRFYKNEASVRSFRKKLKKDKYYHCVCLDRKDIKLGYVKNTALAKKLYKNAQENGEWLEL